ncbi:CehA/McbA family metallohydrolase [Actinoplanes sp. NPDC051346]|uniref:CehA/McbA family metallohydrolase n=1 Tax=Actinoplanes sp. NPDC051346 TaxID=3155048 RepID=UPI003447417B
MSLDRDVPRTVAARREILRLGGAIAVGGLLAMTTSRGAAAGPPADPPVTTTYTGHSPPGFDQWEYVPFDVPAGVNRISVRRSYDPYVLVPGLIQNVLDIGIFGPAGWDAGAEDGFRGWSGGARDSFTLSASDATPGYLPGPIEAGRWAVVLGPIVANPLGMDWQVDVTLEFGPPGTAFVPSPAPTRAVGRGAAWYRGDMHVHTVHSDGQGTQEQTAAEARARGLDFFVSTEHNTRSANQTWGRYAGDDLLIIAGEEVTTRHGHWVALGLPADRWVDWRYGPDDGLFAGYAESVRAAGGLVVPAHPSSPGPGSTWEFGHEHIDGLEVWNGPWTIDDVNSVRIWDRFLRGGRRLAAFGNSDAHSPAALGHPQTVVYAPELSRSAILAALRAGRSYLAESASATLDLTAAAGGRVAGPGQSLEVGDDTVEVRARVSGMPSTVVSLHAATGQVATGFVPASGAATVTWRTRGSGARFVRAEVQRPRPTSTTLTTMVALSNPVWLV